LSQVFIDPKRPYKDLYIPQAYYKHTKHPKLSIKPKKQHYKIRNIHKTETSTVQPQLETPKEQTVQHINRKDATRNPLLRMRLLNEFFFQLQMEIRARTQPLSAALRPSPIILQKSVKLRCPQKKKNREVNVAMPRFYFFFTGAFFFLTGFLDTTITLGILYMSVIRIYNLSKPTPYLRLSN
jgi:hypothetical protein